MQRCSKHNIALSPQGQCIVCKREAAPPVPVNSVQGNPVQGNRAPAPLAQATTRPSRWLLVRSLVMLSFAGWMLIHQLLKGLSHPGIVVARIPHSDNQTQQRHSPRGANETPSADDLRVAKSQV
ncbi:MAG TPA: hypothetical protein VL137_05100, partial [Polyangiaceae bacterium]|nr:hypothetical protein [Polyangiaceae bacterium]